MTETVYLLSALNRGSARRSGNCCIAARLRRTLLAAVWSVACAASAHAETYVADPAASSGPDNYLDIVRRLQPGDILELPPGNYPQRLNLQGVHGAPDAWITIAGPASGPPATITTDSACCNIVQLGDTEYVALKNLTIDAKSEEMNASIDAINAKGQPTHDILIEDCVIFGAARSQQTVGISTKSAAWNWVVRGNSIIEAGTGAYFGNSNGAAPFIAGIVEGNLFVDTIGYNMQVKYQTPYQSMPGMPAGPASTIIRDNVFLKRRPQSTWASEKTDGARPNLLVGGFPDSGAGSADLYEIYANFFYSNADGEALLQASGRVAIHDNLFVDAQWIALVLRDHDLPLEYADVYHNTIYGGHTGLALQSSARQRSALIGNLIFAETGITGSADIQSANFSGSIAAAENYLTRPSAVLGQMDFYPLSGALDPHSFDLSLFAAQSDFSLDFNRHRKAEHPLPGAYAGEGENPGWRLDSVKKTMPLLPRPPDDLSSR